jgi:hypothetical protein
MTLAIVYCISLLCQKLSMWLKEHYPSEEMVVEWLPLSFFESHAHFSLCIGEVFSADVHVRGGTLVVKKFVKLTMSDNDDDGSANASATSQSHNDVAYQSATFSSEESFSQFLKLSIQKAKENQC